tara:strand:- start:581 stop:772 length:192 start_codon:yes stop_codon:yes gene_type:complete
MGKKDYNSEVYTYHDYLTVDTTEYKYHLLVDDGVYHANSIFGLITEMIGHRLSHFIKGEGWRD